MGLGAYDKWDAVHTAHIFDPAGSKLDDHAQSPQYLVFAKVRLPDSRTQSKGVTHSAAGPFREGICPVLG